MMKSFWLVASATFLMLSLEGCALRPYHMQIEQGTVLTSAQITQLQIGMTQAQVSYLLGTPNLIDPYQPNSWYYIYTSQENYGPLTHHKLVVNFDAAGNVSNFQESNS